MEPAKLAPCAPQKTQNAAFLPLASTSSAVQGTDSLPKYTFSCLRGKSSSTVHYESAFSAKAARCAPRQHLLSCSSYNTRSTAHTTGLVVNLCILHQSFVTISSTSTQCRQSQNCVADHPRVERRDNCMFTSELKYPCGGMRSA